MKNIDNVKAEAIYITLHLNVDTGISHDISTTDRSLDTSGSHTLRGIFCYCFFPVIL